MPVWTPVAALLFTLTLAPTSQAARYDGVLTVRAFAEADQSPLAVRMELRDARGRIVRVRPKLAAPVGDSLYFDGEVTLELRRGDYEFFLEAGPEYRTQTGRFTIDRRAEDSKDVPMLRRVDMQREGWYAADVDARLPKGMPAKLLPTVARAAGLDWLPLTDGLSGQSGSARSAETASAEGPLIESAAAVVGDERGRLILLGGGDKTTIASPANEDVAEVVAAARERGALVVARSSLAWNLPVWVARGWIDAVAILSEDLPPSRTDERPVDKDFFPGKQGPGRFREAAYHHLLNCGLKLPPVGGSRWGDAAKGRPTAVLGAGRTYVHLDGEFSPVAWLAGLREGRTSVTNGPLLRTTVEGEPPGAAFPLGGKRRTFQIGLNLAFYERAQVEYLEIVKDGRAVAEVRLADLARQGGKLPPVTFDDSGWFLVRAVANAADRHQFATSGPYYVDAATPRVSRKSVKFFLDWLDAAQRKFAGEKQAVEQFAESRAFWEELAARANAE
jgi:hypothetical protein